MNFMIIRLLGLLSSMITRIVRVVMAIRVILEFLQLRQWFIRVSREGSLLGLLQECSSLLGSSYYGKAAIGVSPRLE